MGRTTPQYLNNVSPGVTPDLTAGLCMPKEGRDLMDKVSSPQTKGYLRSVAKARRMCGECPVQIECQSWSDREDPPGSWGGFLAGRTAAERARRER